MSLLVGVPPQTKRAKSNQIKNPRSPPPRLPPRAPSAARKHVACAVPSCGPTLSTRRGPTMRLLLPLVGLALPLLSVAFMVPQLGGLARGSRQRLAATPHPASSPRVYARAGRRQVSLPGLAMSTVRQVALEEDLMGVVAAAAQPLPNRPDGTVVVVLYSSEQDYGCMATDQEFERMSEKYTDCVFLVCHKEYVGSDLTMSSRRITAVPAFEVFSRGSSVGTIFGPRLDEVEKKIRQFGFSLSKTDLFSDTSEYNLSSFDQQFPDGPGSGGVDASKGGKGEASNPWDDAADKAARAGRRTSSKGAMAAPRTTARYFPGFGMGQDAAENVEKKGSTLDEFQRARQGAAFGGVKIPDYVPGEGGGPGKGFYETAAEAFREGLTETFKKPPAEKGPQRNGDDDDAEDLLNGLWDVPEYK